MNTVTPAFLTLLSFLCLGIIFAKRENMVVPLIVAMCFLPADISIQIATLDFQAVRIVALVALLKMFLSNEHGRIQTNAIDRLFFLYIIVGYVVYVIASHDLIGAFINRSGRFVDSVILYIVIRNAIYSKDSLRLIIRTFSICIIVLLPFALFEFYSSQNLFAILGRSLISIRNGEVRTATTFSHSILFGSFAAALVPIFWAEYKYKKSKTILFSVFCCVFFVYASSSSGPIVALAGVIFFLIFFRWKRYGSAFAKLVLVIAIVIHLIREQPLWHLLYVRLSIKGSSAGWHRFQLMEAAVKEFWNWCWIGYGDLGPQWHTKYWSYINIHFTDVTNHYLLVAVQGGFLTMFLFILLCYKVIKILGVSSICAESIEDQWLWWGFTVMMVTHCITFLSVAYFGQITMLLYLTVAVAAFAYDELNQNKTYGP